MITYIIKWDEIIYPFPNASGAAVEVWELISYSISHFTVFICIHAGLKFNPY